VAVEMVRVPGAGLDQAVRMQGGAGPRIGGRIGGIISATLLSLLVLPALYRLTVTPLNRTGRGVPRFPPRAIQIAQHVAADARSEREIEVLQFVARGAAPR
jgi:hypothetical protein